MDTISSSHSCVWLMSVGGKISFGQMSSTCVFLELSEWHSCIMNEGIERHNMQLCKNKYLIAVNFALKLFSLDFCVDLILVSIHAPAKLVRTEI